MQLGIIGLGRMGAGMARRLQQAGHACVVHDRDSRARTSMQEAGAVSAATLEELVGKLKAPRAVWIMLPAAAVGDTVIALAQLLSPGDVIIDGGNSHFHEAIRRAAALKPRSIHYLDVGTSGGIWGVKEGYCLMIGGEAEIVQRLDPIFFALAPGKNAALSTPGRSGSGTAEQGYLHCGSHGAGHFVKMVHNGIEYGIMQAYAEGLNVLKHAGAGRQERVADAETAPLSHPEDYQYDFKLEEVAEVWRRGSVIRSWLLDLTAHALLEDPALGALGGRVADSGEGRWTLQAAIDTSVPVPVLSAALYARYSSRGEGDFANRILSALRREFGGHGEAAK